MTAVVYIVFMCCTLPIIFYYTIDLNHLTDLRKKVPHLTLITTFTLSPQHYNIRNLVAFLFPKHTPLQKNKK